MTIKVSAICSSETVRSNLTPPDASLEKLVFAAHTGSVQALAGVLRQDQPDVVLLDFPVFDDLAMTQVEAALLQAPGTHLVLVSPVTSVEFLRRAMHAGVRDVLPAPLTQTTVQQAVELARGHPISGIQKRKTVGKVIAMIPAKGGAGATFLLTNLAYALSRQDKRVAVLDLNLYFGDAAIFLGDKKIGVSLLDIARQVDRLDAALLQSSMLKLNDNLHLLPASESPEELNEVSTTSIEKIIELARSQYDFVLLDISSTLDQVAVKALDLADIICLTLQLNLTFIRAAKHMTTVFRELGYAPEKLRVIVNRYEKGDTITLTDVERATQLKISHTIPNSHGAVSASVNQGVPLLEMAPRDPVARALRAWAQELAPGPAPHAQGWWRGWMGSRQENRIAST